METDCYVCDLPLLSNPQGSHCCHGCQSRLKHALRTLPPLYVRMHVELSPGIGRRRLDHPADRVSWKARERPVPIRIALFNHAQLCVDSVYAWGLQAVPLSVPRGPTRPGYLLQQVCRALVDDLDGALRTRDEADKAARVWEVFMRARGLLGIETEVRPVDEPCPSCQMRALVLTSDGCRLCRYCGGECPVVVEDSV